MKEDYGNDEYIISIPVSGHLSLHDKDEKSSTFLVVFEDEKGEIRRGELAILDDANNSIDSLSMYDLYLNNPLSDDEYSLKLVSLQDYMFVDKTMSEGSLKFHNSYFGQFTDDCIDYYRVFGHYDLTGKILDYETIYLGCLSCPPNAKCSSLDGGGGGGGNQTPIPTTKEVNLFMGGNSFANFSYTFSSLYNITGLKNTLNPSLSTITEIVFLNNVSSTHTPIAIFPNDPRVFTYRTVDHSQIISADSKSGTCNILVEMHFINANEDNLFLGHHNFNSTIL